MKRHAILVVDDEPDVVQSVKDLLRLDYTVHGATSAAEGMKLLEEHEIDVVMTDQRMPEMTGVEFLKKVRGPHPDATRLLFTGYADISAVIAAINQGNVYRYITKPWDPDELQTIINEACERHDLIVQRKELMDALEQSNNELRNADALKSAFIQVASHELRTPLAIANGFSELAIRQKNVPEPLHEWIERVHRALKRLAHLVNQIISMLEAGRFEQSLKRQPTDIAKLLHEAIEDLRPFLDLRKQKLIDEIAPDVGTINIDAEKLRDSIDHVILNAIKFTPDEGTITIRATPAATGGGITGGIRIQVTDSGCGIDPEHLPHLGQAFFTGFDVTHHKSGRYEHGCKGLGLGLSVVKSVAALHGGSVDIQSELKRGTTVTIMIPPEPS